eukprot:7537290-Lingulodinium_polyedra.AAC.1
MHVECTRVWTIDRTIGSPVVCAGIVCGVYNWLWCGVYNKGSRGVCNGPSHGVYSRFYCGV